MKTVLLTWSTDEHRLMRRLRHLRVSAVFDGGPNGARLRCAQLETDPLTTLTQTETLTAMRMGARTLRNAAHQLEAAEAPGALSAEFPQQYVVHGPRGSILAFVARRGDTYFGKVFVRIPTADGRDYHVGDLGYEMTSEDLADVRRTVGGLALTLATDDGLFDEPVIGGPVR